MRRKFEVEFAVDDVKAFRIAERLFDQFNSRKGFFADYSMPEYVLPRNLREGTKEHALFLTYVISIDYMTDAEKLWKRSRGAYELYPDRFTPEEILKVSPRTVETLVKSLGARFYSNAAKTWIKISRLLVDKYGGDPRNITREPLEIDEVKRRLRDFPYLRGNKLSNFYIRAMGETGLFKVKNINELDIRVDKQVARFTMYTGVLKLVSEQFTGRVHEEPMRGLIEEAWRNAARKLHTAPWKLDEPIWTVGSKLCSGRKCGRCPVKNLCDKAKGITFKLKTLGLISCTKSKRDYPCRASEMYQASDLFRKAYTYATKNYDFVAILSTKYGLLFPDDKIEPYNLTLNKLKSQQRRIWAERVFNQMKSRLSLEDFDKVFFHAGEKYRQDLIPRLEEMDVWCEVPLKNLSMVSKRLGIKNMTVSRWDHYVRSRH